MNPSALIVFCLLALLSAASAMFIGDREERSPELLPMEEPTEEENLGLRFRRATCDLFSPSIRGNSINHSACAAHCLFLRKGFKGGRCVNGICRCRK